MTRQGKTHIRLGIHSGSPSDQSPRCLHEETLVPYLPIAKFRGVSPRNVAEFLHEMSRSFSTKCRGVSPQNVTEKTLGEISDFYFSLRKKKKKKKKLRKGCSTAKCEKRAFFLGWSVHPKMSQVQQFNVTFGMLHNFQMLCKKIFSVIIKIPLDIPIPSSNSEFTISFTCVLLTLNRQTWWNIIIPLQEKVNEK